MKATRFEYRHQTVLHFICWWSSMSTNRAGASRYPIDRPRIEFGYSKLMDRRTARFDPGTKISERFLQFSAPLLSDLPNEEREHKARQALIISFSAWNAVIFADVLNDHRYLQQIRDLTAGKPETLQLIEHLIARKRALFFRDERLIGDWEVTGTEDGINLRAEARDPYSLPRDSS